MAKYIFYKFLNVKTNPDIYMITLASIYPIKIENLFTFSLAKLRNPITTHFGNNK